MKKKKNERPQAGQNRHSIKNQAYLDGAGLSPRRGIVYSPTTNTRKEVNPYERDQIMRRVRWTFGNTGIGRRCTKGLAGIIGYLVPNPTTSDTEWNEQARKIIERRMRNRDLFDVAGKFTWNTCQLFMDQARFRDGDVLVVFTTNDYGQAQFAFYESHQIVNPENVRNGVSGWYDGVRTDANGRHVAYGVKDNITGKIALIGAKSAKLYYDPERAGQVRGVSVLTHALNNILDIVETRADIKHGFKIAALFGLYQEKAEEKVRGPFAGTQAQSVYVEEDTSAPSAKKQEPSPVIVEDVMAGGQIADLDPGSKIGTISDSRPGPQYESFTKSLIADIAWGVGISPAVLWDIAGLTGPAVRYTLNEIDRYTRAQNELRMGILQNMYNYILAVEMKAGRLPQCKDADWWNAVEWIGMASLTIDKSRDSSEARNNLRDGLMTLSSFTQQFMGCNWQEFLHQRLKEQIYMEEECKKHGISPERVFGAMVEPPKVGTELLLTPSGKNNCPEE